MRNLEVGPIVEVRTATERSAQPTSVGKPINLIPNRGVFSTQATRREDALIDLREYVLNERRDAGKVRATQGITRPFKNEQPRALEDILDEVLSWKQERKDQKGGFAADGLDTPPTDNYRTRRYDFLSRLEGVRTRAYDDATGQPVGDGSAVKGLVTIGVGFNMERPDAREVLERATGRTDFDALKSGKARLTKDETRKLFDRTAVEAENFVRNHFKGVNLTEHQRIALVSLAFNNPSLIGPSLTAQIKSGDFLAARDEILYRSNLRKHPGLASRRYKEAAMFVGEANAQASLPNFKAYMNGFLPKRNETASFVSGA